MCQFFLCFRFNILKCLKALDNDPVRLITLTAPAVSEMTVWWNFLNDPDPWVPICHPPNHPPLCTKTFFSDAAGCPKNSKNTGKIGCGVIGLNESGSVCLIAQLWWPSSFILSQKNSKGKRFGEKTATLEQIGLLLPLVLMPEMLKNQHVIFKTDNMSCVYGHQNGYMKGDECASILIKCTYLIGAFLGCAIHVEHVPRRSNWESEVADNLSREHTTGFLEEQLMKKHLRSDFPAPLLKWLESATEDWSLPDQLLEFVVKKCSVC
jgi:hypothetical protein